MLPITGRAPRAIFTFAWLALLPAMAGTVRQPKTDELPADLAALQTAVRKALSPRDNAALAALAEPGALPWLSHRGRRGDENWQFYIASLPAPLHDDPAPQQPNDPLHLAVFSAYHSCQSIGDHFHRLVKAADGWKIGAEIPEAETLGCRVRDHKMDVRFDLAGKSAFFTDQVLIEKTAATPATLCLLRLSANLQVDEAREGHAPVSYTHVPGFIAVKMPDGKSLTLSLAYHGAFDQPAMDTYVNDREVFLNSYWYPHIGRLPAKLGLTVTVPKGWSAIGQGNLVSQQEMNDTTVFRFRNEIPVSYFSLDAAAYRVTTRHVGSRVYAAYQLQENPREAERALDELQKVIPYFEKTFCRYPYSRYTVVQTLGPFGGALEAYSFSTYAGRMFGAVTHEVSHTWWGGIVPNTYTKTLWNESFADYSQDLMARQTAVAKPPRALSRMHPAPNYGRDMERAFAVPIAQAFDTENGADNAVGYGKGALVLDMLEDEIGTEKMIASLRRFIADHPAGEAGDWPEFERAVDKTTGQDFRWFFDQWTERGGVPVVRLAEVSRRRIAGTWTVTGRIAQEGKPYRLTIPVAIETAAGNLVRKMVTIDGPARRFTIPCGSEPLAVQIDPDGSILMAGGKATVESPFLVRFR